jgi:hypothetical protein
MTMLPMDEAEWGPFEALARISDRPPALPGYPMAEPRVEEPEGPTANLDEVREVELTIDAEGWPGRLA